MYLETIRIENSQVYNLEYHQWRLERSLNQKKSYNLSKLLVAPDDALYRCRVLYSHNDIMIEYIPYVKRKIAKLKLIYDDSIEYEKKYANRERLNQLFHQKESADDILIIKNSLVSDTSIANVAFYDGKRWITPRVPLLEGTTRRRLLEKGEIELGDICAEEISSFKKIALMNAMIDFDIIAEENIEDIIC
jgi:4-amino-4-deoxychorismate lyase